MTLFGAIWILLIISCFSKIENIVVLTIISSTLQCNNVLQISGIGIGPQVITSLCLVVRVMFSIIKNSETRIKIKNYSFRLKLSVFIMFAIITISSILNSVLGSNYARLAQIAAYIICFYAMFYCGKYIDEKFIYRIIKKTTIALIVIGFVQFGITSGLLPRLSIVKTLLYNDTSETVIYYDYSNYYRMLSTYMEPSYFAGYIVGAFYYFLSYKQERKENYALLSLIILAILLTFSSSAYGAFVIVGIIFFGTTKENKLKIYILIAGILGFAVMYLAFFETLDTVIFSKMSSNSAVAREIWNEGALIKFYQSPLWGNGYKTSRASTIIYTLLSEIGVVGLVAYIITNCLVLYRAISHKYGATDEQKGLALAVISVVATQIIAVPDIDICTYWMWMNLFALSLSLGSQKKC